MPISQAQRINQFINTSPNPDGKLPGTVGDSLWDFKMRLNRNSSEVPSLRVISFRDVCLVLNQNLDSWAEFWSFRVGGEGWNGDGFRHDQPQACFLTRSAEGLRNCCFLSDLHPSIPHREKKTIILSFLIDLFRYLSLNYRTNFP